MFKASDCVFMIVLTIIRSVEISLIHKTSVTVTVLCSALLSLPDFDYIHTWFLLLGHVLHHKVSVTLVAPPLACSQSWFICQLVCNPLCCFEFPLWMYAGSLAPCLSVNNDFPWNLGFSPLSFCDFLPMVFFVFPRLCSFICFLVSVICKVYLSSLFHALFCFMRSKIHMSSIHPSQPETSFSDERQAKTI